jgi:mannose-6-phosphate isomerase-like protein (cupin superfamily)
MERFKVYSIESLEPQKGRVHWFRNLVPDYAMREIDLRYLHMKPGERIKNHIHQQSETLIISMKGTGRVVLDGNEYNLPPGHVAFATKGCPHGYEAVDEGWEFITIQCPTLKHPGEKTDYISVDESPDIR